MILVVCPSFAVDKVAVVDYRPKATLRPIKSFEWPGGSGVHAGLVAQLLGARVEIIGYLGGLSGQRFTQLAQEHGLTVNPIPMVGNTRTTFSLIDRIAGNLFDMADPAPAVDPQSSDAIVDRVRASLTSTELLLLSGSLPSGLPDDTYAGLIALAKTVGVRTVADLTGKALLEAVRAGPWLVKPSLEELQRDGILSDSPRDILSLANSWVADGVENVCISLAAAGLLWVSRGGSKRIGIVPVNPYNTIGCGDTLVGAVAAASVARDSVELALRKGVAAATANLNRYEPGYCEPNDIASLLETTFVEDVDERSFADALGGT